MGASVNCLFLKLLFVGALALATTDVNGFQQQQAVKGNTNSNRNSNLNANANANTNYLDSLTSRASFGSSSQSPVSPSLYTPETRTPQQVAAETPDEHYAKEHFGAGWAGYNHSLYGGYLDQLNTVGSNDSVEDKEEEQEITTTSATTIRYTYTDTPTDDDDDDDQNNTAGTNSAILQAGKKAEYGDDIRWGAQVYLDNL
uniref:Uncharacterized protein n=1 Tax=Pseudo-nitzschia australis TaxID=44445 RepID=A0A7S4ADF2_9STRA|mmetsp:Transcript_21720/g.45704  ORF Transcript_21720/g.45704 Transcript_21720/m.45704 type:complete len:200 (+) Transcript_21720:271-870(+)